MHQPRHRTHGMPDQHTRTHTQCQRHTHLHPMLPPSPQPSRNLADSNVQCVEGCGDDRLRHAVRVLPLARLRGAGGLGLHRYEVQRHCPNQQGESSTAFSSTVHCVRQKGLLILFSALSSPCPCKTSSVHWCHGGLSAQIILGYPATAAAASTGYQPPGAIVAAVTTLAKCGMPIAGKLRR